MDVAEVFDPVILGLRIYVEKNNYKAVQKKNLYIYKIVHRNHIHGRGKLETYCYAAIENSLRYI